MSLESFIKRFAKLTEEYKFYGGTETLRYEVDEHRYLLVTPDGLEPLWGVTSVSNVIDKSEILIPWGCKMMAQKLLAGPMPTGWTYRELVNDAKKAHKEKLEEAGNIGHIAHAWIEKIIKMLLATSDGSLIPELPHFPEDERAANCCRAAVDWMSAHNVRWISTERKVYSRTHKYAGTTDGTCLVDSCNNPSCCPQEFTDRLSVADWKTSNGLHLEYVLQTAAYEHAIEEEDGVDIQDRWILRLGKEDAAFEPWHFTGEYFDTHFQGFLHCLNLRRSVATISDQIKVREQYIKDEQRAVKKAEREVALKIKCPKADKYKGKRPSTCNGTDEQCETCHAKYRGMLDVGQIVQKEIDKNVQNTLDE